MPSHGVGIHVKKNYERTFKGVCTKEHEVNVSYYYFVLFLFLIDSSNNTMKKKNRHVDNPALSTPPCSEASKVQEDTDRMTFNRDHFIHSPTPPCPCSLIDEGSKVQREKVTSKGQPGGSAPFKHLLSAYCVQTVVSVTRLQ